MTADLGMNLAGVELEQELARTHAPASAGVERRAQQAREEMAAEVERVHREFRAELVPYVAPGEALRPSRPPDGMRIAITALARPGTSSVGSRADEELAHAGISEQRDGEVNAHQRRQPCREHVSGDSRSRSSRVLR